MPATETKPSNRGKIHFESPNYRVYERQPHLLYILNTIIDVPDILERDVSVPIVSGKWVPYKYKHRFDSEDNDCLRFAEALASGVIHYTLKSCVFKVGDGDRKFGVTDKKNLELALKWRKDEEANPRKGQAYAIVRTDLFEALKIDEEVGPYHIAYVIEEDGDWRVTLEADAGNPDLSKPEFGIYSTTHSNKSFHKTYKNVYGNKAAATIVLEKK